MPYETTGIFTPVAGAITAQAGDVIRSVTWDNINTDYTTAFTTLGQQLVQAPRLITSAGNLVVSTSDYIVIVQASAPVIFLPASNTRTFPLKIMGGAAGIFGTNNSVVTPAGGETISGLSSVTLNNDYQVMTFYPLPTGGYLID